MSSPVNAPGEAPCGEKEGLPDNESALLLEFLQSREVRCPRCRYDLRAARTPVCPECGTLLRLAVESEPIKLRWFLLAIAPGFFSGICAAILIMAMIKEPGAPGGVYVIMWTGVASGVLALLLCGLRRRFLRISYLAQALVAIGLWGLHLTAFYILIWVNIVV